MAHIGSGVEYALHCLLHLTEDPDRPAASARDLAEFQDLSPTYVAKIFTKLEKAGLVRAGEGVRGGFRLARPAAEISFLDVVDAIEQEKSLFDCRKIRQNCILYRGNPPPSTTRSVCGIHAVMLRAEKAMRDELARHSLADIATGVSIKLPVPLQQAASDWFTARAEARGSRKAKGKMT